jgi:hypothetical protein
MERKIFRGTQIKVLAILTGKITAADDATLQKQHPFAIQNARDYINKLFNIVKAAYGEDTLLSIVLQTKPQQKNEFVFFHTRKFERLLVKNHHF